MIRTLDGLLTDISILRLRMFAGLATRDADFVESDHPRDDDGQFANAAGGGGGSGTIPAESFSAHTYGSQFHEPATTENQVLARFAPEMTTKMADAVARATSATQTIDIHKPGGTYTAARSEVHAGIAAEFLSPERVAAATPATGEKPLFTILGGRGGSGKGWFKGQVYDPGKNIVLDSDEIKGMLPEYEGWNAAALHEEASDIFDHITAMAVERGVNIVHDATMKTGAKAVKVIESFKKAGYDTAAHYMYLPAHEAAKRAVDRFISPAGRLVPPNVVLANTTNEASFDMIKPLVGSWSFRDNNVKPGQMPRLVSQGSHL